MARSRFRGTCSLLLLAGGLIYAAVYLTGEPALPDSVVQQIEAGKAAKASLRKVTEDISQLKEQLTDAESERESQSSLLERNNQLIDELKKSKQAREKEAADAKAAAERADAAAKLAIEKANKEKEQRERLQKEKDEAVKRADDAAAAALKRAEAEAAAGVRAKADADRASLAVAQAKAEADAAAKHAADAAARLHEAERAAAGQPNEAAPPASAAKPAAAAAAAQPAANGKKPLPLAITDLSQIPGRACCPGDPYDMAEYDMTGTAYVTLASGNDAARSVIVLVQALRDVNTRVDKIVVMLSRGGMGSTECRGEDGGAWKRANKREHIHHCGGPDTIAEEIVSPQYLATLTKLGATIMVVDEIPSTPFTEAIPGGRATFWGMALNKLRVFNMTQFKKVIWMDGASRVGDTRHAPPRTLAHRARACAPQCACSTHLAAPPPPSPLQATRWCSRTWTTCSCSPRTRAPSRTRAATRARRPSPAAACGCSSRRRSCGRTSGA